MSDASVPRLLRTSCRILGTRLARRASPLIGALSLLAAPSGAEPLILRSTTPTGRFMTSLGPELLFGSEELPPGSVNSHLMNSLIPRVFYGVSDREQVALYPLGMALRFGETNGTELIPALSLNPFFGHSPLGGATIAVRPLLSFDARQWIQPGSSVTFGGAVSSRVAHFEGCQVEPPCKGSLEALTHYDVAAQAGLSHTFGPVTIALGAAAQYTFNTARADLETVALTFGSRVRHGLISDPTVRIHLSDVLSLDLHFEYTRTLSRGGQGLAIASAGANIFF